MDFKKPLLALGLLALTASAQAVDSVPASPTVSMGVDAGSTFFVVSGSEDLGNGKMENKGVFCGMRAEMEFVLPKAYHVSLLGVYAPGSQTSTQSMSIGMAMDVYEQKNHSYLWQVEAKAGKTLEVKGFTLLPYVTGGWYHTDSSVVVTYLSVDEPIVSQTKMDWKYAGLGLLAEYSLSPNFSLGLGAKGMKHLVSDAEISINDAVQVVDMDSSYGYEVYMPVKWWFGPQTSWYVHAEPFMLKIDAAKDVTIYGGRISFQKSF